MQHLYGRIWDDEPFYGHIGLENGIIVEIDETDEIPDSYRCNDIFFDITDTHTHIGDAGLKLDRKYSLEELVAPPNGLKHRYLSETSDGEILDSMKKYAESLKNNGVSRIFDFREGGIKGIEMLKKTDINSVILGRPVSPEFDVNEMEEILESADGVGIPSISDMDHSYIDSIADIVHRKGKYLAVHVSERIREDVDYVLSLNPDLIIHLCEATDSDLRKISDEGIPVSVCTRSNLYFGKIPPLKRMSDAGCHVTVGTDNAMLASPDIFEEARVFRQVASEQDCSSDFTAESLARGRKILNKDSSRGATVGMSAGVAVTAPDFSGNVKVFN